MKKGSGFFTLKKRRIKMRILKKITIMVLTVVITVSSVTMQYEKTTYAALTTTVVTVGGIVLTLLALGGVVVATSGGISPTPADRRFAEHVEDTFYDFMTTGNYMQEGGLPEMTESEVAAVNAEFYEMMDVTKTGVQNVSDKFWECWKSFCGTVREDIATYEEYWDKVESGEIDITQEDLACYSFSADVYTEGQAVGTYNGVEYKFDLSGRGLFIIYSAVYGYRFALVYQNGGGYVSSVTLPCKCYRDGSLISITTGTGFSFGNAFAASVPIINENNVSAFINNGCDISYAENFETMGAQQPDGIMGDGNDYGLTSGHGYEWGNVKDWLHDGVGNTDVLTGDFCGTRSWDWVRDKIWEKYMNGELTYEQAMAYTNAVAVSQTGVYDPAIERVRVDPLAVVLPLPDVYVGEWEDTIDPPSDEEEEEKPVADIQGGINAATAAGLGSVLTNVFPFCIPFDLFYLVDVLNAEPETPHFEFLIPFPDPVEDYTWVVDFEKFEEIAKIVRVCETILFIGGLILITRNIIKG